MHILAILMSLFVMLISIAAVVFWVWTLIDCITNKRLTDTQKIVWALVIFFIGFIGSLIYLFAGRSPTPKVYVPVQPYYYQPQTYHQPQTEQGPTEDYRPYQEGYQAQSRPQLVGPEVLASTGEEQPLQQQVQYEHIQISYPE